MNEKKLATIEEITNQLESEGVSITPSVTRARLKEAALYLAREACQAFGVQPDEVELDNIAGSRAFQEAIASVLRADETS